MVITWAVVVVEKINLEAAVAIIIQNISKGRPEQSVKSGGCGVAFARSGFLRFVKCATNSHYKKNVEKKRVCPPSSARNNWRKSLKFWIRLLSI